ncbi:hypothetical protein HDV04_004197 [Boothiomyces sp. JEL0838]|nr:hypothetical protein HDV04_004197 [Boothiomyces sp. JEL0838]
MSFVPPANIMMIYCFHFGCTFALSAINLFPLLYLGRNLFSNISNILALINSVFGILVNAFAVFPILSPIDSCVPDQILLLSYVITDVAVDIVLCIRCISVIPPSKYSYYFKLANTVILLVVDFIVRIWHVGLSRFTMNENYCLLITDESTGLIASILIIAMVCFYGIVFSACLFQTKSHANIGWKGAVFTLLLIAAKVGLLIPYVLKVLGEYSIILVGWQVSMQNICLTMTSMWIKKSKTKGNINISTKSQIEYANTVQRQ